MKVLVVDDSMIVRVEVTRALLQAGHEVIEARNGVAALEILRHHPDTALVVSDVTMPVMGGLDLLRELGESGALARLDVVMLTVEGQPHQVKQAKALGAKAWILKPFKGEVLLSVVQKLALGGGPVDEGKRKTA